MIPRLPQRNTVEPLYREYLSGYDLAHAMRPDGAIDLTAVLAGSEGTLAFIVEALLRVTPIPAHKRLVLVGYDTFDSAITAAAYLLAFEPSAIETIDETILGLARTDMIWPSIVGRLAAPALATAGALNLVELCDSDLDRLRQRIRELINGSSGDGVITAQSIESSEEARALWALRERGVGLLANMPGPRRPLPFVEDCAVPPQRLQGFIAAFRAILEAHGLNYGMYGHVDVGCLHVRPALDMADPADAKILREVSDRVFRLVQEFGGVFWGEHGKGMRSEYNPEVFGPVLYEGIRRVKQAFDPFNQMNPGKIATPAASDEPLVSIDGPTRGDHDRTVAAGARIAYEGAIACNGNGACLTWDVDRVMCPSMKVTADRVHSPKGRAALMREWLRQLSMRGWDTNDRTVPVPRAGWFDPRPWLRQMLSPTDFSHEVYAAFAGCLSCKACVAECPLHVDIPGFKAEFLHAYHQRYPRRLADHLLAHMEELLPRIGAHARGINRLTAWTKRIGPAAIGLVDLPSLAPVNAESRLRAADAEFIAWGGPSPAVRDQRCVAVIPDAFTNYFAPCIVTDLYEILRGCGVRVVVLPYRASGKSHHVRGFLHEFRAIAKGHARDLAKLAQQGVELICVEPAIALFFRQEYHSVAAAAGGFHVELPQEWMANNLAIRAIASDSGPAYQLMSHCTEATTAAAANRLWQAVFERAGLRLEIPLVGCCGMAGAYGHEKEHAADSRGIFAQSWQRRIAGSEPALILATGHSCRTQVARIAGFAPKHPIEVLAASIRSRET